MYVHVATGAGLESHPGQCYLPHACLTPEHTGGYFVKPAVEFGRTCAVGIHVHVCTSM